MATKESYQVPQSFPCFHCRAKGEYSHNMLKNPIKYKFMFDEKTITCDDVNFFIGRLVDNTLQDNIKLPHYIALGHGICYCRNPSTRRLQVIHNKSWRSIISFETGQSAERLMPHIAKLAKSFAWTKSYAEIKELEKRNFDKYFLGILLQLSMDCGAWEDVYPLD